MSRPIKLTLDFFMHDAFASGDRKIKGLRRKHGNDGYACYFTILEMLCREDGMKLDLSNLLDSQTCAEDCHLRDEAHLFAIIETCVEIGLFNGQLWRSDRVIFSDGLSREHEAKMEERRKEAARCKSEYGRHREAVYERDGFRCVYCGSSENLSLDHRIPQSRGGTHDITNLVTCCSSCNSSKGARTPQEWLEVLS